MKLKFIIISLIFISLHSKIIAQTNNFYSDSIRALELNRKANDLGRQGLYAQSLSVFFESLKLRQKIYGEDDPKLAPVYLGLGVTYKSLGQLDLALKYYKQAEKNYKSPSIVLYTNIGSVYQSKLDFTNALVYYEQALTLAKTNSKSSVSDIAGIYYNIADIYYLTNRYDDALKTAKQNVNQAYIIDQIQFNTMLAYIYQMKGEIKNSIISYQKRVKLTVDLYGDNHIEVAKAYLSYSFFLTSNNQFQEAEKNLKNAYQIISQIPSPSKQVLSDYYKWEGYWHEKQVVATENISTFKKQKRQNLEEALEWYKKSLNALNFSFDETNESDLISENYVSLINCIAVLKLVADIYTEIDNLEKTEDNQVFSASLAKAIETYQIIGTLIQRARKEISNDESKMELTTLEYATFSQIIQASYSAYIITKDNKYLELAFQNAERLKSSSLFEKISNQLALENSRVPDSLLQMEFKLNNTIAIFNEKIIEENSQQIPDSIKLKEYNNEVFNATRQREELNRVIESEYNDFYELKYSKSMLTARSISEKLKEDQVIIEYYINENDSLTELYTFVLGKHVTDFRKQRLPSEFHFWVENMFQFMSDSEFLLTKNDDAKEFCNASYNLYRYLILPFENELKNKKITIIPDGKLSYIPFDALLTSLPDTTKTIEFNKLDYSIWRYTFNYANSANLLVNSKSEGKKGKIKIGAFAPAYTNGEVIEYAGQHISLIPLPGVQKEVEKIAKLINCELFTGNKASEDNFRKYAEEFDILHLAMHAFVNDSMPALSSFAFTQTKSDDLLKNGLLNTADIYNLKLNANLTVLSSCNTGSGALKKGEGIMSLARGFLYAGCPSVIMSLWEVEDNSGTKIITSFYKNLKGGKAKDEALRNAKLEYLESVNSRLAHPHYWLGFISLGDNKPMFISYDFYFFVVLIIALAGIGIDQLIRIKKARKKRAS
ncbi:MAG: CHAT domain-containing protein [Draconibacterium sp.]